MLEPSAINAIIFGISFALAYYALLCIYFRKFVVVDLKKMLYYISLFCLFGVSGELFTNTIWKYIFNQPLWMYQLFPAHGGNVSYFFPLVWGTLGYYKYFNDQNLHRFKENQYIIPGLIMGAEAIFLELLYNGLFHLLFGGYIFYYLPSNLGIFSHLSCLQVIPFYFIVGLVTNALIVMQKNVGYGKHLFITLAFYWMILTVLIFF